MIKDHCPQYPSSKNRSALAEGSFIQSATESYLQGTTVPSQFVFRLKFDLLSHLRGCDKKIKGHRHSLTCHPLFTGFYFILREAILGGSTVSITAQFLFTFMALSTAQPSHPQNTTCASEQQNHPRTTAPTRHCPAEGAWRGHRHHPDPNLFIASLCQQDQAG